MRVWNVWIALFTSILKCTFNIEYSSIEMYINIKLPKAIYTKHGYIGKKDFEQTRHSLGINRSARSLDFIKDRTLEVEQNQVRPLYM